MISYFASLKRLFASEFSNFKFMIYNLPFIFFRDEEHPEVDEGESYIEPEDGDHRET